MLTSQQGRELMADALRAVANVLDKHRQQREPEARANQDETRPQSLRGAPRPDEPASAAGMDRGADAALDVQLPLTAAGEQADAMTSMQTGLADARAGTDRQDSGKRRSSRKKAAEGPA